MLYELLIGVLARMKIVVQKLCEECNKEFELHMDESYNGLVNNMQNCPHCGARNDTWIVITIEKDESEKLH